MKTCGNLFSRFITRITMVSVRNEGSKLDSWKSLIPPYNFRSTLVSFLSLSSYLIASSFCILTSVEIKDVVRSDCLHDTDERRSSRSHFSHHLREIEQKNGKKILYLGRFRAVSYFSSGIGFFPLAIPPP